MKQRSRRTILRRSLWSAALFSAVLLTLACGDVTIPTVPDIDPWKPGQLSLSMVSGNNQTGEVGQPLATPFEVRVVDRSGGTVSGAVILWDIVEGGGDLPAAPKEPPKLYHETKTDAQGIGSIVLTLGPRPGQNVVEARVMFGTGRATFVANGEDRLCCSGR